MRFVVGNELVVPGVAQAFADHDLPKLQELLERSQREGGRLKSRVLSRFHRFFGCFWWKNR